MMRKLGEVCRDCGGTGMADSGGTHPWGEPAMIPCGCEQYEPLRDGVSIGLIMELVERAKKLPDLSTTGPIPLTPIQIAFIAGKLNQGRAASGGRAGWVSDPDSIPQPIIDACRNAIRKEFGINGTDGYYKRILAKVFAAMLAAPLADEQAGKGGEA
jgi:hypothetical protein